MPPSRQSASKSSVRSRNRKVICERLPRAPRQCGLASSTISVSSRDVSTNGPLDTSGTCSYHASPTASHDVPRPRVGRRRGEHVREVVARLAQHHLERVVVERIRLGHVLEQERRRRREAADVLPGVDEVVRRQRLAVAPAGVVVQLEQVRQAVGGDAEVLGQRRHHVQVAVDDQEAAEQVLGERARVGDVRQARRERARPDDGSGQPLAQLGLEEGLDLARERLVVGALGALEVEREVVHERDLEQRLARAAVVAQPAQELPRPPVVADRLAVGGEAARLVAGADQILGRLGGVVGGGVVAGELRERARARVVARPAPRARRRRGRAARGGGRRSASRRRPPARARAGTGTPGTAGAAPRRSARAAGAR